MFELSLYQDILQPVGAILALGIPFAVLEHFFPRRLVSHRRRFLRDLWACILVVASGALAARFIRSALFEQLNIWAWELELPKLKRWALIPTAGICADFTLYWVHRGLHTRLAWRAHRWHHSPTDLYWLAGIRASILHNGLFQLNGLVWLVLLRAPGDLFLLAAVSGCLANHWMHANIRLATRRIEWLLVTPRTHLVHHSREPAHHGRNFGAVLSVWDHLFGTFANPDTVGEVEPGIPEQVLAARQIVGL